MQTAADERVQATLARASGPHRPPRWYCGPQRHALTRAVYLRIAAASLARFVVPLSSGPWPFRTATTRLKAELQTAWLPSDHARAVLTLAVFIASRSWAAERLANGSRRPQNGLRLLILGRSLGICAQA